MGKKQDKAWRDIFNLLVSNGGEDATNDNLDSHPHTLFIELNDGEFCTSQVFTTPERVFAVLGSDELRYLLSLFDDTGYLISVHTRDDAEDMS